MKRLPQFRKFYQLGIPAKYSYSAWKRVEVKIKRQVDRKLAKLIAKKARKFGTKAVPIIGTAAAAYFFIDDCEAEGFWKASRDAVIGSIPYVGTGYNVYQVADLYLRQRELVDEEVTARVYTGAYDDSGDE